jgi:hypothetical protein
MPVLSSHRLRAASGAPGASGRGAVMGRSMAWFLLDCPVLRGMQPRKRSPQAALAFLSIHNHQHSRFR